MAESKFNQDVISSKPKALKAGGKGNSITAHTADGVLNLALPMAWDGKTYVGKDADGKQAKTHGVHKGITIPNEQRRKCLGSYTYTCVVDGEPVYLQVQATIGAEVKVTERQRQALRIQELEAKLAEAERSKAL